MTTKSKALFTTRTGTVVLPALAAAAAIVGGATVAVFVGTMEPPPSLALSGQDQPSLASIAAGKQSALETFGVGGQVDLTDLRVCLLDYFAAPVGVGATLEVSDLVGATSFTHVTSADSASRIQSVVAPGVIEVTIAQEPRGSGAIGLGMVRTYDIPPGDPAADNHFTQLYITQPTAARYTLIANENSPTYIYPTDGAGEAWSMMLPAGSPIRSAAHVTALITQDDIQGFVTYCGGGALQHQYKAAVWISGEASDFGDNGVWVVVAGGADSPGFGSVPNIDIVHFGGTLSATAPLVVERNALLGRRQGAALVSGKRPRGHTLVLFREGGPAGFVVRYELNERELVADVNPPASLEEGSVAECASVVASQQSGARVVGADDGCDGCEDWCDVSAPDPLPEGSCTVTSPVSLDCPGTEVRLAGPACRSYALAATRRVCKKCEFKKEDGSYPEWVVSFSDMKELTTIVEVGIKYLNNQASAAKQRNSSITTTVGLTIGFSGGSFDCGKCKTLYSVFARCSEDWTYKTHVWEYPLDEEIGHILELCGATIKCTRVCIATVSTAQASECSIARN